MIAPLRANMPYAVRRWAWQFRTDAMDASQEFELWKLEGHYTMTQLFYRVRSQGLRSTSLDAPVFEDNEESTLLDMIPDLHLEPEDNREEITKRALWKWYNDDILTDNQAVAIYYAIVEQWPFSKIDREFELPNGLARFHYLNGIRILQEMYAGREPRVPKVREMPKGSDHPAAKLDESEVIEIRRKYASGDFSQMELARIYGVHQATISAIIRHQLWKDVADPLDRFIDVDIE